MQVISKLLHILKFKIFLFFRVHRPSFTDFPSRNCRGRRVQNSKGNRNITEGEEWNPAELYRMHCLKPWRDRPPKLPAV